MHVKSSFIVVTLTVAILFGSLVTTAGFPTMTRVLAYESSQTGSLANDCGNADEAFNILCQNLLSQIEGDKNAINIIGLQTGGERTPEPPSPTTGTLRVIKEVVCPAGISDCPVPEGFGFEVVTGNNPDPASFQGSSTGVDITLGPGDYSVEETSLPRLPANTVNKISLSEECSGTISVGETKTCTITNTIIPNTATLIVKKVVVCEDPNGLECPNLPDPSAFTMSVFEGGILKTTFQGSALGTTVTLQPGNYFTGETVIEPPAGLRSLGQTFSDECGAGISGDIQAGETRTCTWTNKYALAPPVEEI